MFRAGDLVTLTTNKTHPEEGDPITLVSGTCGLVTRATRKADDNHEYVVDFGAYGGWYCTESELIGPQHEEEAPAPEEARDARIEIRQEDRITDIPQPVVAIPPVHEFQWTAVFDDPGDKKEATVIDFESDLKKRMEEIERGE